MTKKDSKSKKNPVGSKVTKEFEFKLTDPEIRDRLRLTKELRLEYDLLFGKFEEMKDAMKTKLAALAARRDDTYRTAENGVERRTVESTLVKDFDAKEARYYFEGVAVEIRALTDNELQMEVDFKKLGAKAKAVRQKIQKPNPVAEAHAKANGHDLDVAQVHKLETGRRSKTSSVDGPTRD